MLGGRSSDPTTISAMHTNNAISASVMLPIANSHAMSTSAIVVLWCGWLFCGGACFCGGDWFGMVGVVW